MINQKYTMRILSFFLFAFFLFSCCSIACFAKDNIPSAEGVDAVYVMNLEYGQVVYSFGEDKPVYPASTAKLVTALVAERAFSQNLSKQIEITEEMKSAFAGRCMGLSIGEKISVEALLHAMLIGGYNDASIALAFATAGNLKDFCAQMNEYVTTLGARHTFYTNPTGLHDVNMVTTARDTAYIAMEIMENQTLYDMTKKPKFLMPATNKSEAWTIYSRNSLISSIIEEGYYYSYADGIHAGSTDEGGDCVVTSGNLDGLSYVCVVLGGRSRNGTNQAFITASNTLRYALKNFSVKTLKTKKTQITTLPVLYSATVTEASVYPYEDLSALVETSFDISKDVIFETALSYNELHAPFKSGTVVGHLLAKDKNGKLLAKTELIVTENVESHGFLVFMAKLKRFVLSPFFLVLLLLIIVLIWWSIYSGKRGQRRRSVRRRYYHR